MYKTGAHEGISAEITACLRNFLIYLLIFQQASYQQKDHNESTYCGKYPEVTRLHSIPYKSTICLFVGSCHNKQLCLGADNPSS